MKPNKVALLIGIALGLLPPTFAGPGADYTLRRSRNPAPADVHVVPATPARVETIRTKPTCDSCRRIVVHQPGPPAERQTVVRYECDRC